MQPSPDRVRPSVAAGNDGKPHPPHGCNGCSNRWAGLGQAHCSADGCHLTFSTAGIFDRHRVGSPDNRSCLDPRTARKNGQRMFDFREGPGGVIWIGFTDEPWTGPDD